MEKTVSETGYDSWSIIILDSGETNFQAAWLRWKEVNSETDSEKVYGVQSQGYIHNLWSYWRDIYDQVFHWHVWCLHYGYFHFRHVNKKYKLKYCTIETAVNRGKDVVKVWLISHENLSGWWPNGDDTGRSPIIMIGLSDKPEMTLWAGFKLMRLFPV